MKTRDFLPVLIAVAVLGWPPAAVGVEILAPPEHASTAKGHVHVVGQSGAGAVDLHLNGEWVRTVAVKDSVFHALVRLPTGLNRIDVFPSCDGGRDPEIEPSDDVEVLYGPGIPERFAVMYPPYTFHDRKAPAGCVECHEAEEAVRSDADGEWCYTCHEGIRGRFQAHMGSEEGACIGCHRVGGNLAFIPAGNYGDTNPCFLCHKDKIGEFTQEYVHGPVAGGACTICHDPHGSQYEMSLQQPVPLLCVWCHSELTMPEGDAVVHAPFKEGRCVDCHDPHSTSNRWVLVKDSRELCTSCHTTEDLADHSHPFDVKPRRGNRQELILTEAGKLECLSCHLPHHAEVAHLLRTDEEFTCFGCHPEQK